MQSALFLFIAVNFVSSLVIEGDKSLSFVYALWRHGDRSPSTTFSSDPIQESSWTFGEEGFGVLTPIGMEQHFNLGRIMRSRYVDSGFLSQQYRAKEVKVFASKIVRTQVSAVSNMIGMYGSSNGSLGGISYPETPGWPTGFIPVPAQILEEASNALMNCRRSTEINELVGKSKAFEELKKNPKTQFMLSELTRLTGITAILDTLEQFFEPLFCESIHFPSSLFSWCPREVFDAVIDTFKVIDDLKAGVGLEDAVEGVDLSYQIPLLHGGYFTQMMKKAMKNEREEGVKYYAVSAHDVEVSAVLSIFGLKSLLYKGRPNFAASILFELWTDETGNEFVKVLFRNGDSDNLRVVTSLIEECDGDFCPIDVIQMYITRFNPGDLFELCAKPLKVATRAARLSSQ